MINMVTAPNDTPAFEEIRERALHRLLIADDLTSLPDDGNRYEIIGGQLIVSPSPNMWHQEISFELAGAIYEYLKQSDVGKGYTAPADVHLSAHDVVQPDILVVLREHLEIVQRKGIIGAPDLVIEILSPSSIRLDYLRKSKLYEQYGVREYWIVDPESEIVSVQILEGDRFVIAGEYSRSDTLTSNVLDGFTLDLASIFPEATNDSAQSLKEELQPTNDE
jgi:Uma2 family endonuclease